MEMELVQRFPSLSFQIQDLVAVVEDGEKRWRASDSLRPFIESGQVGFQAQDFFSPQSRKLENENFMIKQCLHNWTDEDAVRILKNLRAGFGAGAKGKLYAVEFVLTPSSGRAAHMIDINILTLVSSIQRTEAQFEGLFASAGWKLERTVETRSGIAVMVASPV